MFRFVKSSKRGQYSVWRGDMDHLGFITKIVHRLQGRTKVSGWALTAFDGRELSRAATKDDAARALWNYFQAMR